MTFRNLWQYLHPLRAKRSSPLRGLAYFVAIVGIGWTVIANFTAASTLNAQSRAYTIYLFNPFEKTRLAPLDPATLNDLAEAQVVQPGRFWRLSADGSTLVNMEYPQGHSPEDRVLKLSDIWVVVHNRQTGTERKRFHPPAAALPLALSDDGARLALEPYPFSSPPIAEWYVMDTATGRLLAHVKDAEHACRTAWFDSALQQRTYCLVQRPGAENTGPYPVQLIAYDLAMGTPTKQLELANVLMGGHQRVNGDQRWEFLEPGVALSADGQRLAVVHANANQVTVIDAPNLSVEHTVPLTRQATLWDWFAPKAAYAKNAEGTIRQAVFSPDGHYLYIFTQEVGDEAPSQRGLWVVDLESGHILADALPEFQIQWAQPAPDGSVYAFGTTDTNLEPYEIRDSSPSTLWRLDALTLKILVKREFTGYRGSRIVVTPVSK